LISWQCGGELAERGELLGLHQAILRGAQIVEGFAQIGGALAQFPQQACVFDRDHGLLGEIAEQVDLLVVKEADLLAIDGDHANDFVVP